MLRGDFRGEVTSRGIKDLFSVLSIKSLTTTIKALFSKDTYRGIKLLLNKDIMHKYGDDLSETIASMFNLFFIGSTLTFLIDTLRICIVSTINSTFSIGVLATLGIQLIVYLVVLFILYAMYKVIVPVYQNEKNELTDTYSSALAVITVASTVVCIIYLFDVIFTLIKLDIATLISDLIFISSWGKLAVYCTNYYKNKDNYTSLKVVEHYVDREQGEFNGQLNIKSKKE